MGNRSKAWTGRARQNLKQISLAIVKTVVKVGTLPYYRIFQFNTLKPIVLTAAYASRSGQSHKLLNHVTRWRTNKLAELQFVSIASAILSAATIGAFSWTTVPDAYWLASALWYSSLVLSILAILLAAQQITVLRLIGKPLVPTADTDPEKTNIRRFYPLMLTEVRPPILRRVEIIDDRETVEQWRPRWKMVFIWQCPTMFLSYSVSFFLVGLTLFVCTPLVRGDDWNAASNTAVVYLATSGIAGAIFLFGSFWIYHNVDFEAQNGTDETDRESESSIFGGFNPMQI